MHKSKSGVFLQRKESVSDVFLIEEQGENDSDLPQPTIVQIFEFVELSQQQNEENSNEKLEKKDIFQTETLLYSAAKSWGSWFGIGTQNACIALWKIDKKINFEETSKIIHPKTVCKLEEFWEDSLENKLEKSKSKVTSSILFEDKLLLIRGHENGEITMSKLPSGSETFTFKNGHQKKVTFLWRPDTSNFKTYFVSAGADCVIKLWDVQFRQLIHTFNQHTAPITHILGPPERKSGEKMWRNLFFSVSLDRSIALLSLENYECKHLFAGHNDIIESVSWRLDQDFLIVGCIDGTVSVWELGTGQLEQKMHNQEAIDILETCTDLMVPAHLEYRHLNKSIYSHSYFLSPNESPLQIIQLNIQTLLQDLLRTLKSGKSSPALPRINSPNNNPNNNNKPQSEVKLSREELLRKTKAFQMYSYFLPWNENRDQLLQLTEKNLGLTLPSPFVSFGMRGENGILSFLVPSASIGSSKWRYSSHLTALLALCSTALSNAFLDLSSEKNAHSQLLSYFCTLLPESLEGFVEPSLPFLANFWQDAMLDVKQSARSIFNATIERLDVQRRQNFSSAFAKQLTSPVKVGTSSRAHAVLVLAILGSQRGDSLEDDVRKLVAQELMALLFHSNDKTHQSAAAELLGKGYSTWQRELPEPGLLMHRFFKLCMSKDTNISNVATSALTSVGAVHPEKFITALSEDLFKNEGSIQEHATALRIIRELVVKNPVCLLAHLPKLVHAVVMSLDPSIPNLREGCIRSTTSVLQTLVKKYPMVSFHQVSQHLALGTEKKNILIYDLKSATLWHTLEGHTHPLTALNFSDDGKFLASYSYEESKVKIWSITSSFFGFGSSPHCTTTIIIPNNSDIKANTMTLLEQVQIKWQGNKVVILLRGWEGSLTLKV